MRTWGRKSFFLESLYECVYARAVVLWVEPDSAGPLVAVLRLVEDEGRIHVDVHRGRDLFREVLDREAIHYRKPVVGDIPPPKCTGDFMELSLTFGISRISYFAWLAVFTGVSPIKPEVHLSGQNYVSLGGKHQHSGSNEGSTVFLRQLPGLTGNDSSNRKSVITVLNNRSKNICPESFIALAQLFQNHS